MTNALNVTDTPARVPLGHADVPVLVNLGPDTVYIGSSDQVATGTGIPLGPNVGYQFPNTLATAGWGELWAVSDGDSEIRYGSVG
jgi:hypothetical protein